MIHLSTDSCKWPGAPSRGALGHLEALLAETATPFLFQLVLHVCRGYGWVRVLVKLKNSQLVGTQRIAGVQLGFSSLIFMYKKCMSYNGSRESM